jgi:hypothetical protein
MSGRTFSVAEVNARLPELERVFQRLSELKREIGARANEIERLGVRPPHNEAPEVAPEIAERKKILEGRVAEFQAEIDQIEKLGGILRDLDLGLVDFPSVVGGEEVFLSWQTGEPAITHFYPPGAAFSERRRIPAR